MIKFEIGEIVKIVGTDKEFPFYDEVFPKNLITEVVYEYSESIKHQPIKAYNRGDGGYWCPLYRVRGATDREKFLYYINGEPFIVE